MKTSYLLLFLLVLTSCEGSSPLTKNQIVEKYGHMYVWVKGRGYTHDPECHECKRLGGQQCVELLDGFLDF